MIQSDNDPMMRLLHRVLPQARLEERSDGECTYRADITVAAPARDLRRRRRCRRDDRPRRRTGFVDGQPVDGELFDRAVNALSWIGVQT